MALIELKEITKTYFLGEIDVPVLKGITLSIDRGEYVALMGASGSGKSTLMNILGCLDRQTTGEYLLDGEEVGRASGDRRAVVRNHKIGFVFQSFNLLPRTSALDNVIMPLSYTAGGLSRRECRRRGMEMLKRVGLAERFVGLAVRFFFKIKPHMDNGIFTHITASGIPRLRETHILLRRRKGRQGSSSALRRRSRSS